VQSVLATAVAIWLIVTALDFLGLAAPTSGTLQAFILDTAEHTNQGGSAFERTSMNLAASIPMAFVNMLGRPFVTEAHNPMALVSALEMMAFWALVIRGRRQLRAVLWQWRQNRLLRFATLFSVLYVLMLGVTFQNLGIISRQRTLVMPALLLIVAAAGAPAIQRRRTKARYGRRIWSTATAASPSVAVTGTRS
jgi:hypothetical protein